MAEFYLSTEHPGFWMQPVSATSSSTDKKQRNKAQQQDFKSLFQRLVEERGETLEETLEQNDETRKELEELQAQRQVTEIIRRVLPDGTIMVTHYEKGKVVNRFFKRPHYKEVPDESAPVPRANDGTRLTGQQKMKFIPKRALLDDLFG
ncbi:MAG: hypothetical protein K6F62_03360 [Schwartzia sp.]|nr:hypothetical protein [Schwartzia sp. (in: firmicutes)]